MAEGLLLAKSLKILTQICMLLKEFCTCPLPGMQMGGAVEDEKFNGQRVSKLLQLVLFF